MERSRFFFLKFRNQLQGDGSMMVGGIHPVEVTDMTSIRGLWLTALWATAVVASTAFAQSIEVGHKLTADLSHAKTYSWRQLMPPKDLTLYLQLKAAVDRDLQAKGWQLVPNDGDISLDALTLILPTPAPSQLPNQTAFGGKSGYTISQKSAFRVREVKISVYSKQGKDLLWRSTATSIPVKDLNQTFDQIDQFTGQILTPFPAAGK
jgi:hypothetical protein